MSTVHGSNDRGPHGMARYGDEWRRIDPVDGRLTTPKDADEFVLIGGGGRGEFGDTDAERARQNGAGGFVRAADGQVTFYVGGFDGLVGGGGGGPTP